MEVRNKQPRLPKLAISRNDAASGCDTSQLCLRKTDILECSWQTRWCFKTGTVGSVM